MAALQALGIAEKVRAAGHLAPHAGYQDPRGRWLLRMPSDAGASVADWIPPARVTEK